MCTKVYLKYSCDHPGRYLGRKACCFDLDSRELRKRNRSTYQERIDNNERLCEAVRGMGYSLVDRECVACGKAKRQEEFGADGALILEDEDVDSDTGSFVTVLFDGESFVRARSQTPV